MRLIDADKLLEYITSEDNRRADSMQWDRYAELTANQPTAYDVDKILKQLEDLQDISGWDLLTVQHCLEIVKAGGAGE